MKNILYGVIDKLLGTTKQTLSVEFVPYTMHYLNVRAVMSRSQWNMFCTATHRRNHGRCCECSSSKNLECHEQWSYELDTNPKPREFRGLCAWSDSYRSATSAIWGSIPLLP